MAARFTLSLLAGLGLAAAGTARAQSPMPRLSVEGLAGAMVPTFDIADVAKTGPMFGAAVSYQLSPRWALIGEFDYGLHKDKPTGSVDIKTLHYIAKVGYSLTGQRETGWEALVNLGAGAVSFDVQGAPSTKTYFAINAGAKLAYNVNRSFAIVVSPQGDIAFSKKSELTTTNAWVWPISAGVRLRF